MQTTFFFTPVGMDQAKKNNVTITGYFSWYLLSSFLFAQIRISAMLPAVTKGKSIILQNKNKNLSSPIYHYTVLLKM